MLLTLIRALHTILAAGRQPCLHEIINVSIALLRPDATWGQRSGADVILPTLLSRLLVLTVNSRTGRADLLVTIVK